MESSDLQDNKNGSVSVKPESVKKNFSYQTIYQLVILVLPFITAPFMTRRLGDTALGNYSYVSTFATYFTYLAMLGISNHGNRAIAAARSDQNALRHTFWELFVDHAISSVVAIVAYVVFAFFMKENQSLYFVLTFSVASSLLDLSWLFAGLENFKKVTIANLMTRIVSTVLVLVFIRKPDDIIYYALISVCSGFISPILLWPWVMKNIPPVKVTKEGCLKHVKPLLVLFVAYVAFVLHGIFDKTLLGLMTTKEEVAYYNYASRINDIPKTIINVITIVFMPRISALIASGDMKEVKNDVNISLEFVTLFGIGSMFGFLAVGPELATVYLGEQFSESGKMLMYMSPLSYIYVLGSIARDEYLIPTHRDKGYTISFVVSAVVNVGLSFLFIYLFGPNGAIIGTLVAEVLVTGVEIYLAREVISFKRVLWKLVPYSICGLGMYGAIYLVNHFWQTQSIIHLISLILIGLVVYTILASLYLLLISDQKDYFRNLIVRLLHIRKKKHVENLMKTNENMVGIEKSET